MLTVGFVNLISTLKMASFIAIKTIQYVPLWLRLELGFRQYCLLDPYKGDKQCMYPNDCFMSPILFKSYCLSVGDILFMVQLAKNALLCCANFVFAGPYSWQTDHNPQLVFCCCYSAHDDCQSETGWFLHFVAAIIPSCKDRGRIHKLRQCMYII